MTKENIVEQIELKRSFLCIGLDSDIKKLPKHLLSCEDPIFEFNKAIVDATAEFCISYKPNLAFYEEQGTKGFESFVKTCRYIRERHPEILIIADAKRGDIGNTSDMYARAFYQDNLVDAVTLSPYMGADSVTPFLKYEGKWAVILALTSNESASDFELLRLDSGERVYERVLKTAASWGSDRDIMFVVGATQASELENIRKIVPNHFLLVPGVGAQGGSLEDVVKYGINESCGLIVNSSRGVIFASSEEDFAQVAGVEAKKIAQQMSKLLAEKGLF